MSEREPTTTRNLDSNNYGLATLEWSRARDHMKSDMPKIETAIFLGTVGPSGNPHAAGVGALYHDGDVYFTTSPKAHKARHLAANPNCTFAIRLQGLDLVLEGTAARVRDRATLETLLAAFNATGWPAELDADGDAFTAPFSAPSAGPPPWHLYRFTFHTVFGVAGAEPGGATRWRFAGD